MAKLTLNVDAAVVEEAKKYATELATSLSAMVEAYLRAVVGGIEPPVLRAIRGSMRAGTQDDYKRYLERKYLSRRWGWAGANLVV